MRFPATYIADYYRKNRLLDEETIQKMEYTIKAIFNELSKLIIFIILFSLLGKQISFLLCYLAFVSLRIFAGGLHCKTYWGCFTFSLISFLMFIYIPDLIDINIRIMQIIAYISCLFPAVFSPVLPSFRNIKSSRKKTILKITAVFVTLLWTSLSYTVISPKYSISILLALSIANFQLIIPIVWDKFYGRKEDGK